MIKLIMSIQAFAAIIWLAIAVCWCANLYKLTKCDFEPTWKGEIVHAIGLIPPAAIVTVWFDDK